MQKPGTILKLWNKAQDTLDIALETINTARTRAAAETDRKAKAEFDRKKAEAEKKGKAGKGTKTAEKPPGKTEVELVDRDRILLDQNKRIVRGLKILRTLAAANLKQNEAKRVLFLKTQKAILITMKKHCLLLKKAVSKDIAKEEQSTIAAQQEKVLKKLKQLTVLTRNLAPETTQAGDDEESSLDDLNAVQTDALDRELQNPQAEQEAEEELPEVDDEAETAPTETEETAPPRGERPGLALFKSRLAKLMPTLQQAFQAAPEQKAALEALVNEANALARAGKTEEMLSTFDALESDLAAILQHTKAGGPEATYHQRRKGLEPRVLQLLKAGGEQAGKVRAVFTFAEEKANAGDYNKALAALDNLEKLLATVPVVEPAPTNEGHKDGAYVQYAKARLDWDRARKDAQAELTRLKNTILETYRGTEDEKEAAENIGYLDEALDGLDGLEVALDRALNASGGQRQKYHNDVLDTIRDYQALLNSRPILTGLDDNPFEPCAARTILLKVLTNLASKLHI